MKNYVCITEGVWWHNSLWSVGHEIAWGKKEDDGTSQTRMYNNFPKKHFVCIDRGKAGLMDFAKKEFNYNLDQNLNQGEMLEMIAKLNSIKRNRKREDIRLAQRKEMKEKADRVAAFIEKGASVPV